MKSLLLALLLSLVGVAAAEPASDAVRAADDARVAAMLNPDKAVLDVVLSEDLRYAHSNGKVDTKASLTASLLDGEAKYLSYKYTERNFRFPAPDVLQDPALDPRQVTPAPVPAPSALSCP